MGINNNFSVENVYSGLRGNYKPVINIVQKVLSTEGLKDFATIVIDRDNEDYVSYSIEAFNNYNEAVLFGNFVNQGLESLSHELKLINSIKNKFSIEKLNPYTFSMEKNESAAPKKANLIKRIFSAIATVFKKLIMTIGNWVRALMNSIKGGMLGGAAKFYEIHSKKLPELIKKYGSKTIKAVIPVDKYESPSMNVASVETVTSRLENLQNELKSYVDKIKASKDSKVTFISKIAGNLGTWNATSIMKSLGSSLNEAMSLGNPKIKKYLGTDVVTTKISSPAKAAAYAVFGTDNPKITNTTIKAFTDKVPISIMSRSSMDSIKKFVKEGEAATKGLQKAYKGVLSAAETCEKTIASANAGANYSRLSDACSKITQVSNSIRMLNVYMVGVLLNMHKEYLRLISYSSTIARKVVKAGGAKNNEKKKKEVGANVK